MAELVAGAFLSSFLQVAFERLASHDFRDYFRRRKLDDGLLKNLRAVLLSVDKIIEDAEERQYRDHRVKEWLDELKDEVFKAQDLLDDIATEASLQKLHAESQTSVTTKVRGLFTASVNKNKFEKEIESGIKEVLNNLKNLIDQNEILGLKERSCAEIQSGVNRNVPKRAPATLLIDESDICGRDADKESIVEILMSPNMAGSRFPMDVIAITGMGGMGKTTLARLAYDDVRLKDQFEHRAWVCVYEEFDVERVTKAVLHSLKRSPTEQAHDFNSDQLELKEILMGKKLFLVLDDVWNVSSDNWEVFQAPLKHVAPQSKILITTRHSKLAKDMYCTFTYLLKPLQDGDCWNLFSKHAFDNQNLAADPQFVKIGGEIITKCGGLPLAIKSLGNLLRRDLTVQHWDKVLKSDIWLLPENDSNVIPSLRLNYHYLPSTLKRCFAYCSIFPKDYDIDKNVLIQLWMADGLIHPPPKGMSPEEKGNEIFNDLLSRSFFEPSRIGGDYFIMHDLLNDLAKSVTGEFFVRQLEVDPAQDLSIKTRYFSYLGSNSTSPETFEKVFKCDRLRSFVLLGTQSDRFLCFARLDTLRFPMDGDIMSRFSRLKYLRELSLIGYQNIKTLTDGICSLKHLHYLDLSHTSVEKLPNSMCLLINLQTLKLRGCRYLTELPSNFQKLINLRHLDLEDSGIKRMPEYMGKLSQLQKMNRFVVAEEGGSNLKELGSLKHLTGSLTISNMEHIYNPSYVREANLKEKQLDTLNLEYLCPICSTEESQRHEQFLPKLVSLFLGSCTNIVSLPPLGQLPSLQKLTINKLAGIKVIGEEFYGNDSLITPFPRLSYLEFAEMEEWEKWEIYYEGESFRCLEELHISYCCTLSNSLPQHLPGLKELVIWECDNLEATIPKSPSMESLSIRSCEKITVKDMPTWSFSEVPPPLNRLSLFRCPAMEALSQGAMISNLQHLRIDECPKVIESGRGWGFHELLSLKELMIGGDFEGMECFPEEGFLPPNLQSLSFWGCDNLRRINHRGLLHLNSLTSLSFMFCPSMSFEGMPERCLPPSLSRLTYSHCPLIEERCNRENGPDWPIIAHLKIGP